MKKSAYNVLNITHTKNYISLKRCRNTSFFNEKMFQPIAKVNFFTYLCAVKQFKKKGIMKLDELNREQKIILKQTLLLKDDEDISYYELTIADDLVSDEELENFYGDTDFTEDDF